MDAYSSYFLKMSTQDTKFSLRHASTPSTGVLLHVHLHPTNIMQIPGSRLGEKTVVIQQTPKHTWKKQEFYHSGSLQWTKHLSCTSVLWCGVDTLLKVPDTKSIPRVVSFIESQADSGRKPLQGPHHHSSSCKWSYDSAWCLTSLQSCNPTPP